MSTVKPIRTGASVNAYLLLMREDKLLLLLRQNTGYFDDHYGLVSGHVEDGESATEGMIREAKEEAGISIEPCHLRVVHVLHRQTERLNVDIFFTCDRWNGEIVNQEPEKCAELSFHSLSALPPNIMEYLPPVIEAISRGEFYSECGWK